VVTTYIWPFDEQVAMHLVPVLELRRMAGRTPGGVGLQLPGMRFCGLLSCTVRLGLAPQLLHCGLHNTT
jgi:hypothetical protein